MNNYWKGNQQRKMNVFTISISNYFDAIGPLEENKFVAMVFFKN
jgi:hypothetical protein